jgi:hypothetical protein
MSGSQHSGTEAKNAFQDEPFDLIEGGKFAYRTVDAKRDSFKDDHKRVPLTARESSKSEFKHTVL